MQPNYTSFIILLTGVLLLILNETLLKGQIPSYVFIAVLLLWAVIRFRDIRNMRK